MSLFTSINCHKAHTMTHLIKRKILYQQSPASWKQKSHLNCCFSLGLSSLKKIQQSITHHSCWQWPEKVNKDQSSLPTLGGTPDVANLLRVYYSKCSLTFCPRPQGVLNTALCIIYSWEISAWAGSPPPCAVSHLFTNALLTHLLPRSLPLNSVPYYMHSAETPMEPTSAAFRTFVQGLPVYRGWSQHNGVSRTPDKIWRDILFWFSP